MINRRAMIVAGAAALLGGGAWTLLRPTADGDLLPGAANAQSSGGGTTEITEMVLGDPDAPVEVIEYASFTCPHCASFHANQFEQLKENFIEPGRIRFVYREVYFDRPGLWASMIARCGGEERFFGIADMIYERQGEWAASRSPAEIVENLMRIGKTAGMSDETLQACMQDADLAQSLNAWYETNRAADNIDSTPSFIIDGRKYSNMSYEDFAALLEEKLAAAEADG